MENIKVGDYAKHIKDGYIGKIVSFDNIFVHLDIGRSALRHYIKTAENKIDLIEVGDYVNGYKVGMIDIDNFDEEGTNKKYLLCGGTAIFEEEIESIVTKEQFANMEYKVGE